MIHDYRDETDYIPSHSDEDQYIDANSYILSLSRGQTRNFIIRRKTDNVMGGGGGGAYVHQCPSMSINVHQCPCPFWVNPR